MTLLGTKCIAWAICTRCDVDVNAIHLREHIKYFAEYSRNIEGGYYSRGEYTGICWLEYRCYAAGKPRKSQGPGGRRASRAVAAAGELCFWAQPQPNFLEISKSLHLGCKKSQKNFTFRLQGSNHNSIYALRCLLSHGAARVGRGGRAGCLE